MSPGGKRLGKVRWRALGPGVLAVLMVILTKETALLNINTASQADLEKNIGIGPDLSMRIIKARPYKNIDDLSRVKGMSKAQLEALQGKLTVGQVPTKELSSELITIKRVIDGDTLLLGNGEKVRLIGVDTPEVHGSNKLKRDSNRTQTDIETIRRLGRRSSAFVKKVVKGKRVRLEYDQANADIGHRDRYRRILAYVYLDDGTFLNAEIIRQGLGWPTRNTHSIMRMNLGNSNGRLGKREEAYGEIEGSGKIDRESVSSLISG